MATPVTWPGRSHVSTFVHALHLLDLDQLEDWPEVSIQTFGPKSNLQHRLRCVEWSLYRLFEIYDAKATRDKLRPFFPPSTSLQSVNLRAALLRHLTDLKKDGTLGGTVLLRKTMLDECKGDKFEELLAIFSMIVLKKALAKSGQHVAVATVKNHNVLPLVLSYRKAIQRDVEKRKEVDLRSKQQHRNIDASIHALSEEAAAWKNRKAPAIPKNAENLKRMVHENWIGDTDWVDTVLHGVPPTPGLDYDELPDEDEDNSASVLLTDLDHRVRTQNARLAHWQRYMKTLQYPEAVEPVPPPAKSTRTNIATNRFAHHQDITFFGNSAQKAMPTLELDSRHAALLENVDRCVVLVHTHHLSTNDPNTPSRSRSLVQATDKTLARQKSTPKKLLHRPAERRVSDASSQDTVIGEQDTKARNDHTPGKGFRTSPTLHDHARMVRTPPALDEEGSLAARTRATLAHLETPRAKLQRSKTSMSPTRDQPDPTLTTANPTKHSDRASLLERTRESMSFFTNVLDENYQPRANTRSNRPRHTKSKSMYIPTQRPRLERAWSEESLASAAKDDSFDVDADYESVFKSRPRLKMSPNLSPARNSEHLDGDLEDALNKLTINSSSPEY